MTEKKNKQIHQAIDILHVNLNKVARVPEWAEEMGYSKKKAFERDFVRHFRKTPGSVLTGTRLVSVLSMLYEKKLRCNEIAWQCCINDRNTLYNFVTYHTGLNPTQIQKLKNKEFSSLLARIETRYLMNGQAE